MRDHCRSQEYQWKIIEIPAEHDYLSNFTNRQSLSATAEPFEYSEELLDLKDQLVKRVMELAKESLTPKQYQVLQMYYMQDMTQVEISKVLKVQQNTICKSLIGSPYKTKDGIKQRGSAQKLKEIVMQDTEVLWLLERIEELKIEKE